MTGTSLLQGANPRKRPTIAARRTAFIGIDSITFSGQAAHYETFVTLRVSRASSETVTPVTSELGSQSAISTSVA
jgi:hypothetical protein